MCNQAFIYNYYILSDLKYSHFFCSSFKVTP